MLLHDPHRERLVNSGAACLAALRVPLGAPFACQEVLQVWVPAYSLQRSGSCKAQLPGSPGLLLSSFVAGPTPNWSGIGCNLDVASQ